MIRKHLHKPVLQVKLVEQIDMEVLSKVQLLLKIIHVTQLKG